MCQHALLPLITQDTLYIIHYTTSVMDRKQATCKYAYQRLDCCSELSCHVLLPLLEGCCLHGSCRSAYWSAHVVHFSGCVPQNMARRPVQCIQTLMQTVERRSECTIEPKPCVFVDLQVRRVMFALNIIQLHSTSNWCSRPLYRLHLWMLRTRQQ